MVKQTSPVARENLIATLLLRTIAPVMLSLFLEQKWVQLKIESFPMKTKKAQIPNNILFSQKFQLNPFAKKLLSNNQSKDFTLILVLLKGHYYYLIII